MQPHPLAAMARPSPLLPLLLAVRRFRVRI